MTPDSNPNIPARKFIAARCRCGNAVLAGRDVHTPWSAVEAVYSGCPACGVPESDNPTHYSADGTPVGWMWTE